MKSIADANGKCPTLPKMLNSKTSKYSIGTIGFNDDGWGCATRSFTASAITIRKPNQLSSSSSKQLKGWPRNSLKEMLASWKASVLQRIPSMMLVNGKTLQITTVMMTKSNECM